MKAIDVNEQPWPELASRWREIVFEVRNEPRRHGRRQSVAGHFSGNSIMKAAAAKGLPI